MVQRLSHRLSLAAVAAGLAVLAAVPVAAQTKLRIAYATAPTSHYGAGATAFGEEVAKLTGGRITVEHFANSVLGGEREVIEGLQLGTIDLTSTSTGPVGNFVPDTLVFDVPFLFKDRAHAHAVLDGPIGQAILDKFPARGLQALAWSENGFRHLTNSRRSVTNPTEMKGLKLRTMENEVHMQAFRTLGALPTPMAFTELFTALQQGTVDGQENPIPVIVSSKFSQVQKHLTLTGHVYSPALFLMSKASFDKLSADDKKAVQAAGKVGAKAQRDKVAEFEANGIEELRKQGMTVVTDIDNTAFKASLKPAYEIYAKKFGQDKLDAIANYKP